MRIVFLVPHLKIGGGTRIILNYANLLSGLGHKVIIYVQSRNKIRRRIANFLQIGRPNWIKDFRPMVLRVDNFQEKNILPADAIVATTMKTAESLNSYSGKVGRKLYLIQHHEGMYHGTMEEEHRSFACKMKKIVVSTWLREVMDKEYDQEAELLLNPIDKNLFQPVPAKHQRDEIRILMLHHNYEWKGTAEGVAVVENLKKKYRQIKLVMFGVRSPKIEYLADEYIFNPPQEKLAEIYSSCDIFLCPSWDEGFGLPSLEAMACGLCVVTYDNGGSRDFAFDGKTALVARRRDQQDLEAKLEKVIKDNNLRKKIAKAGYDLVQDWPTWGNQTDKLEEILQNYQQ